MNTIYVLIEQGKQLHKSTSFLEEYIMRRSIVQDYDGIVIGSGPNGLTVGAYLAKAGLKVLVLEKRFELGGGLSTERVTIPGFLHDVHAIYHMMVDYAPPLQDLRLEEDFDLWQKRLNQQDATPQETQELMRQHNPVVIPRNHHVEAAIKECEQAGEVTLAKKFLQVLRSPYAELAQTSQYQDPPSDGDVNYQTFCGT